MHCMRWMPTMAVWMSGFLILSMAGCVEGANDGGDVEICDNIADDDGDGLVDCADEDCAGKCPEICSDGVSNDDDDLVDCEDPDCDGSCPEICDDGRDNDGDAQTDCADRDCLGFCPEICNDLEDNDGDGLADCLDPDCDGGCPEACGDKRDNDGDTLIDCDDPDCDGTCPEVCDDGRDNDLDGDFDCEDSDCDGFPGCPEICDDGRDNDADGGTDCEDTEDCNWFCDQDEDGYITSDLGGDDCDDNNPAVHEGADEVCDGFDNDCDGLTDDEDDSLDLGTRLPFYLDGDGDGYGDPAATIWACSQPTGRVAVGGDCDDRDDTVHPDANEICDRQDNDCDFLIDDLDPDIDPTTQTEWYADTDGDGWGDPDALFLACDQPDAHVQNFDDCDDTNPLLGLPAMWLPDGDGDGYGVGDPEGPSCTPPTDDYGLEVLGEDCDDEDPTIHPDAPEICGDTIDSDCNGMLDSVWYLDDDHDGYGDPDEGLVWCDALPPFGRVENDGDCDDTDPLINPEGVEICNRLDDNCDGVIPDDEVDDDGDEQAECEGDPDDDDPLVFLEVYTFTGALTNFPETDLVGWELCMQNLYGDYGTELSTVATNCTGDHWLLACRETGSDIITLAAYAHRDDVTFDTGTGNSLHYANGVGWYFDDSYSWGFADEVDSVSRSSCDTASGSFPQHRLCWHTGGGEIDGGWRCGTTTSLNSSSDWQRRVYHADIP